MCMEGLSFAPFDAVTIRTVSGEALESGPVECGEGSHEKPLSQQELWTKFGDCMTRAVSERTTSPKGTCGSCGEKGRERPPNRSD